MLTNASPLSVKVTFCVKFKKGLFPSFVEKDAVEEEQVKLRLCWKCQYPKAKNNASNAPMEKINK